MTPGNFLVDFSEAPSQEPLPADRYRLQISDVGEAQKKQTGYSKQITFTVTEGDLSGRKMVDFYMLGGKGAWRFRQLIEALGIDADEVAAATEEELNDLLMGGVIDAQVGVETIKQGAREGEDTNRIERAFAVR